MQWNELSEQRCPIARAMAVLGERWTLLILRESFRGAARFDQFLANLEISPTVLTQRLKVLCEHDILERRAYQQRPPRYEYLLTDKGIDLHGILMALMAWGTKHYPDEQRPHVVLEHAACGEEFTPVTEVQCSTCGETVAPSATRAYRRETGERLAPVR